MAGPSYAAAARCVPATCAPPRPKTFPGDAPPRAALAQLSANSGQALDPQPYDRAPGPRGRRRSSGLSPAELCGWEAADGTGIIGRGHVTPGGAGVVAAAVQWDTCQAWIDALVGAIPASEGVSAPDEPPGLAHMAGYASQISDALSWLRNLSDARTQAVIPASAHSAAPTLGKRGIHDQEDAASPRSDASMAANAPLFFENVYAWLREHRLHKYAPVFLGMARAGTDAHAMLALDDDGLARAGVAAAGARTKILRLFAAITDGA